jgi:TPR repeat protein
MKKLIIALTFAAACVYAQPTMPTLAQIKIAADAGNPVAQDKLAERVDLAQAEVLYRKAAAQGYAHAQGRLGNILLMRSRSTFPLFGLKPDARAAIGNEAVKWITLAANQGDKQGQADFASVCLEGKLVKQDLVEAYKWGELSSENPSDEFIVFSGDSIRDAAILKMNADQIAEARKRVAAFAATRVFTQPTAPTLEQIKIAADAGDPVAQDKLAKRFAYGSAEAEMWYRKAAGQGYVHAQGRLGNMLLMRSRMTFGLKPDAHAAIADEAVKWITLAANQGDKQGQANLADVCLEGKLVKQDLIEAYKWGELASEGLPRYDVVSMPGSSTRDAAILKMNADQIAEARNRVAAFVPHQPQKSDLPEPAWVQKIKLGGISGTPDHRLVLINNQTFAKGDQSALKIGEKRVMVRCLEIREASVVVSIEGLDGTRELKMP